MQHEDNKKPAMEVRNLFFSYGKNKVLKDTSFKIEEGKITTIMGTNGCGKSTLFNLMTKNLYPRKGNIFLHGKNIQPMSGKNLDGMDALYSIVQMPPGIPVATVAIDGGMNAAILAAKILAVSDDEILKKLKDYSAEMKDTVQAKADRLKEVGYEEYLK